MRPSSVQRYQQGVVAGAPLAVNVATTAGRGAARNRWISGGTGARGTALS